MGDHAHIDEMARCAHAIAERRGQLEVDWLEYLAREVEELRQAEEKERRTGFLQSLHIDATETEEELADVILVCLSTLHGKGANIERLLIKKIMFNQNRKSYTP